MYISLYYNKLICLYIVCGEPSRNCGMNVKDLALGGFCQWGA